MHIFVLHLHLYCICIAYDLQIAAEVAAPLAKTREIVLLGDDRQSAGLGGELTRLLAQLPPSVQALTGVDLSKVHLLHSLGSRLYSALKEDHQPPEHEQQQAQ